MSHSQHVEGRLQEESVQCAILEAILHLLYVPLLVVVLCLCCR